MLWKKTIILLVEISSHCWKYGCARPSFTSLAQDLEILVNFCAASYTVLLNTYSSCISLEHPPSSEQFSWAAEKSSAPRPVSEMLFLASERSERKTLFGCLGSWEAAAAFQSTNVGLSEHPASAVEQDGPDNGAHNTTIEMHRVKALPTGVCCFLCNSSVFGC